MAGFQGAGDTHLVDPEERLDLLLEHLHAGRRGLSAREAARRLTQHGRNEIRRWAKRSHARELAAQLTHPLALLLWCAAALAVLGDLAVLAVAIVAVIVLNAGFAFLQEVQAERATEALRELLPPRVRVRRDGEMAEIEAAEVVPGDLLLLAEGDQIPADARLTAGALEIDMSALTGESQPVGRTAAPRARVSSRLESPDIVFAGTLCTSGEAAAVVYATGMATELGRIAALTQRIRPEPSPLQLQIARAARLIAGIAVAAGGVFLAIGTLVAGLPLDDALTFAIGLLVANVPEGLLPTLTLALAVGVRRMARRHALLKRLTAVETLGATDVICTDKTGTLTEGSMSVRRLWTAAGEVDLTAGEARGPAHALAEALTHTAVRCNNAHLNVSGEHTGDPTEWALLEAAAQLGEDVSAAQAERESRRRRLLHFEPRLKRMTTLDSEDDGSVWVHTKGAPLELLERCSRVRVLKPNGEPVDRPVEPADLTQARRAFERFAAKGLRVLAFAERLASPGDERRERDEVERGLTLLGLAALEDPPRADVAEAVARCRTAGIRIIVVTGDHGLTAQAIALEVGIVRGEPRVISGAEIEAMPDNALDRLLHETPELIVARSTPETKLRVVDALRAEGHTVAMTGDGVNDAPALRRADVGVAMGASGTEVAREAATVVLADDSFASIVAAIEEGRVAYDNIGKFITYIFAHATPEVVPFLIFALSGGAVPLPLTALQILAIDLGTETLPALALGQEPSEPGVMRRPPRPRAAPLIDRSMLARAWLSLGLLEAALVTGGFFLVLLSAGWSPGTDVGAGTALHDDYLAATTMTFAGITACQVGTAFAARTTHASLRSIGFLSNRLLLWGVAFELAFAAALIWLPPLQSLFGTASLGLRELVVLASFPLLVWGSDELLRRRRRRRSDSSTSATGDHDPAAGIPLMALGSEQPRLEDN